MDEPPAHTSTGQSDLLQGQSSASFEDADRNMAPYGSPLAQRAQSQAVADFVAFESDEDEEIDIGEFSLTKPEPNSSATAATPSRIGALGGPKQDHEAGPRQCHVSSSINPMC